MRKMFIGGQWIAARDERSLPVVPPSDGEAFDAIARGGAHEVDWRYRPRATRWPVPGAG